MDKRILERFVCVTAFLFAIVGCRDCQSCRVNTSKETIYRTDNPYDLYVLGEGLLQFENAENELVYCKGGRVELDATQSLCIRKRGQLLRFFPRIQAPDDTKQLVFSTDGEIRAVVYSVPTSLSAVGHLSIYRVGEPIFDPKCDVVVDWETAPQEILPTLSESIILSGWRLWTAHDLDSTE
jgi:hypothetical protein